MTDVALATAPAEPPGGEGLQRPPARRLSAEAIVSVLALALLGGLPQLRRSWPAGAGELALLLTVPGFLLLRAIRLPAAAVRAFPLYVVAASVVTLMATGLAVDLIGPPLGVARPLRTVPLTVGVLGGGLALTALAAVRRAPPLLGGLRAGAPRLRACWPLVLPLLAWIGAERLNNGHSPGLAIAAVSAAGVALLLGLLLIGAGRRPRLSSAGAATLVFGAGLALMWGFSLRGRSVYGFDISGELQTFSSAFRAGRWHAAHRNDAYGAMLSLTILPSTFSALTGATPLVVLKVIYPVLFALFPVALLRLAERLLSRRFAFLAVLFVLVQTYLFQQLPAIARQEVALLLFVCLVAALIDQRPSRRARLPLIVALGVGLVVSHYGTTYLTVGLLGMALVLELIYIAVRRVVGRRRTADRVEDRLGNGRLGNGRVALVGLTVALAAIGATAAIWYVPVTDSGQNLSQFISDIRNEGLSLLPNSSGRGALSAYLSGNVAQRVNPSRFAALAQQDYSKTRRYVRPLPQAANAVYALRDASVPGSHERSPAAISALDTVVTIIAQLTAVLAALGALLLWLRTREDGTGRTIALLGVSAVATLVVIRLSGTAARDYNQERAFLQAMVPLAISLAWTLEQVGARMRRDRLIAIVFAAALAVVFLTNSGLRGTILGGGSPANVTNRGEDYERFVVSDSDLAAARWVNTAALPGQIVSTDRYGALHVLAATGRERAVLPVLTPRTLDRDAWVYADAVNLLGRRARGQEGDDYAVYDWPAFIGRFWNLVYANGGAAVYARSPRWRSSRSS